MYRNTQPAWYRDAKWMSGILLVLTLAPAILFFSLAQITERQRAEPLLQEILELTLLPDAGADRLVAVRTGLEWSPDEPLQLMPSVDVFADPTELNDFDVESAINRIAGVLAERTVVDGTEGALALVAPSEFETQLRSAFESTVPQLAESLISDAMLPAGLADGSRFANWPLQALQSPGEPVQPVVGVFIFLDPDRLEGLPSRQIAELVVTRLSERVLGQGLVVTQEAITNDTLELLLVQSVQESVRPALHDLFTTLLVSHRNEIADRLDQSRAVLQGTEATAPAGLAGLISADERADLTAEQANNQVLAALAERAYEGGGRAVLEVLTEADQASRMAAVTPLLDALDARANGRYTRWAWLTGAGALLFLGLLVVFSRGLSRLVNPGLAVAVAAAGGSLLFTRLAAGLGGIGTVGLPVSVRSEGLFAHLFGILAYVGTNLPSEAVPLLVRNHLIVLGVGAALLVIALLLRMFRFVRPRRRSWL